MRIAKVKDNYTIKGVYLQKQVYHCTNINREL